MLYTYPSNRLEDLALLLSEVMKRRHSGLLEKTTIIVPSPGMQHWLNLQLCKHLGVTLNLDCPMPTRFLWDTARNILGESSIPKQSPYKREVLNWRILDILRDLESLEEFPANIINGFWKNALSDQDKQDKQFQFALQLADVFEQYLVFRPDWLARFESSQIPVCDDQTKCDVLMWQAWFWRQLVDSMPNHPMALQKQAIEALEKTQYSLSEDIYIFAVNTISPTYLQFFDAVSAQTNVHFFQLNPCVNYWGDAKSDLAIAREHRKRAYINSFDENNLHPLLRNLGQQGRDLCNMIADLKHYEIAGFNELTNEPQQVESMLGHLQREILLGEIQEKSFANDQSISVNACYSEVRELQVLKDKLLYLFDHDKSLQPKDVLVMCPSIETYSPYINSIFTQTNDETLSLPVSVSDRRPIESEPLLNAFMTLLSLASARFSVEDVMDLLSSPSMAEKFQLNQDDLSFCMFVIKELAIFEALDDQHKSSLVGVNVRDVQHTWAWGMNRLLTGLYVAINDELVDDLAPYVNIEGSRAETMGRFMAAVEQLEQTIDILKKAYVPTEWKSILHQIITQCFEITKQDTFAELLLYRSIQSLSDNQELASFDGKISCELIHQALSQVLSIPETRSQFYSGNITFCSMLPMRSIPFQVIAILGLNQTDFPRQEQVFDINLMHSLPPRMGDRSRRGDDRYLFLESILSARKHLHLSYQHRKISDNSDRQPSLMLSMLIDHCRANYTQDALPVVEHPLHPFSKDVFKSKRGYRGSYDRSWLAQAKLVYAPDDEDQVISDDIATESNQSQVSQEIELGIYDLSQFYKDTLKYYVNHSLDVYLGKPEHKSFEPRYKVDGLLEHDFKRQLLRTLESMENQSSDERNFSLERYKKRWKAQGELPYLSNLDGLLDEYISQVQALHSFVSVEQESVCIDYDERLNGVRLSGQIVGHQVSDNLYLSTTKLTPNEPRISHLLALWFEYLCVCHHVQLYLKPATKICASMFYIDKPKKMPDEAWFEGESGWVVNELSLSYEDDATEALAKLLSHFELGTRQAMLLDLQLAMDVCKFDDLDSALNSSELRAKWQSAASVQSANERVFKSLPNDYFSFLFSSMPEFNVDSLLPYFACISPLLNSINKRPLCSVEMAEQYAKCRLGETLYE